MDIQVLHVPDCSHTPALVARLAEILGDDVPIVQVTIADEDQARARGMRGSPTLLLDGTDPFATEQPPSLSCRLYPGEDGALAGAPSPAQLCAAVARHVRDQTQAS